MLCACWSRSVETRLRTRDVLGLVLFIGWPYERLIKTIRHVGESTNETGEPYTLFILPAIADCGAMAEAKRRLWFVEQRADVLR